MKTLKREFRPRKIMTQYKRLSGIYDLWARLTETRATARLLRLADIRDNQNIVEIACGSGLLFEKIVRRNPHGQNLGLDLSPHMLERTKKRLEKSRPGRYRLQNADILRPDIPENAFDILINTYMIDLMPEEYFDAIANTFYRLLKPGGVLVMAFFSKGKSIYHRFWYLLALCAPSLLTGCRPVSFRSRLEAAGFRIEADISVRQNTFPSTVLKARKP